MYTKTLYDTSSKIQWISVCKLYVPLICPIVMYTCSADINRFPTAADELEAVAEADHSQWCHDTEDLTAADSHQPVGLCSQLQGGGGGERERERASNSNNTQ